MKNLGISPGEFPDELRMGTQNANGDISLGGRGFNQRGQGILCGGSQDILRGAKNPGGKDIPPGGWSNQTGGWRILPDIILNLVLEA
jgi:hypothetical protein